MAMPIMASAQTYPVEINATNFPDEAFRNYLSEQTYGQDGIITEEEIKKIDEMDISSMNISSLKGIEHFTALKYLDCYNNQLTSLNVSECTALVGLGLCNNKLTSLNLFNNKNLQSLDCSCNMIQGEAMDELINSLPHNAGQLYVYNNHDDEGNVCTKSQVATANEKGWEVLYYTFDKRNNKYETWDLYEGRDESIDGIVIDKSNFPDNKFRVYLLQQPYGADDILTTDEIAAITDINVGFRNINSLNGIKFFSALKSLDCSSNQLTSLDISENKELTTLYCYMNNLTSLDVSSNKKLVSFTCYDNQLTSLNVSENRELVMLGCGTNFLTSLDVSENNKLRDLSCSDNHLTSLDLSKHEDLTALYCYNNQLTSLDVSKSRYLMTLECNNNQLTSIKMPEICYDLYNLYCYCNQIKGKAMDELINSLAYNNRTRKLYVYDNRDGNEGNVCTKSQVTTAIAIGVIPYYRDNDVIYWSEYEGSDDAPNYIAQPTTETAKDNAPIYNLAGQRIAQPVKGGIYIVNGKKTVVK